MELCICDDQVEELETIQALAKGFSRTHPEHPLRITAFQSPYDLLDRMEENGGFDLYLLDVIMPHMMGLELARQIRERDEPAEILFLTTSREYAVESYDVRAAGYLVKPAAQDAFDKAVLSALEALAPKSNPSLLLKTRSGVRKVPLKSLVVVESFDHSRLCTLADGSVVETADTLVSLLERLRDDVRFFSPHRAYIVNLEYVGGLTPTDVLLTNGKRVPVSRKLYPDLKAAYLNCTF